MKQLTLILALSLSATFLKAQAPQVSFDHMALVVNDLEASIDFYTKVFGFQKIADPTGNPNIDWVENKAGLQIHFLRADRSQIKFTKSVHLSFGVETMRPFISNLQRLNIAYESWPGEKGEITIRQDGVRQIYIQDPDGYWIEVNDRGK